MTEWLALLADFWREIARLALWLLVALALVYGCQLYIVAITRPRDRPPRR